MCQADQLRQMMTGLLRRNDSSKALRVAGDLGLPVEGAPGSRMRRAWTSYFGAPCRSADRLAGIGDPRQLHPRCRPAVGTPGTVPAQLTFRDLSALRMVKALVDAGLPLRVRREAGADPASAAWTSGVSLAELTVEVRGGGRVHIRGSGMAARSSRGQLAAAVRARRPEPERSRPRRDCASCRGRLMRRCAIAVGAWRQPIEYGWRGRSQLEERDPVAAIDAYRRSLPGCAPEWQALVRPGSTSAGMFAESDDPAAAQECFHSAIDHRSAPTPPSVLQPRWWSPRMAARRPAGRSRSLPPGARARRPARRGALQPRHAVRSVRRPARSAIRHINEYRKADALGISALAEAEGVAAPGRRRSSSIVGQRGQAEAEQKQRPAQAAGSRGAPRASVLMHWHASAKKIMSQTRPTSGEYARLSAAVLGVAAAPACAAARSASRRRCRPRRRCRASRRRPRARRTRR